jgi:hypothetical protein
LILRHSSEIPKGFLADEILGQDFYLKLKEAEAPWFQFGILIAERAGQKIATVWMISS